MVVTFQIFSLLLLFGLSFGELFVFCFFSFAVCCLSPTWWPFSVEGTHTTFSSSHSMCVFIVLNSTQTGSVFRCSYVILYAHISVASNGFPHALTGRRKKKVNGQFLSNSHHMFCFPPSGFSLQLTKTPRNKSFFFLLSSCSWSKIWDLPKFSIFNCIRAPLNLAPQSPIRLNGNSEGSPLVPGMFLLYMERVYSIETHLYVHNEAEYSSRRLVRIHSLVVVCCVDR